MRTKCVESGCPKIAYGQNAYCSEHERCGHNGCGNPCPKKRYCEDHRKLRIKQSMKRYADSLKKPGSVGPMEQTGYKGALRVWEMMRRIG